MPEVAESFCQLPSVVGGISAKTYVAPGVIAKSPTEPPVRPVRPERSVILNTRVYAESGSWLFGTLPSTRSAFLFNAALVREDAKDRLETAVCILPVVCFSEEISSSASCLLVLIVSERSLRNCDVLLSILSVRELLVESILDESSLRREAVWLETIPVTLEIMLISLESISFRKEEISVLTRSLVAKDEPVPSRTLPE